ncbi:MAG: DUF3267 domain-containing protein [Bacilli bacterium]|nr:DUF3267 domain-containing protein [Bacilli bacterium]
MKQKEKKYFYEMDSVALNVISIVLLVIMLVITKIIYGLDISRTNYNIGLILLIPYLLLHEILHSIGYVVNGAKFNRITYGIHLEKGILCCSCKQEVKKHTILWSLMYPFLFIGVITYIIGVIYKIDILVMLSIFNISGCSGDLIMFLNFLGLKNFKFFEYDNPLGFGIVTEENMENKKMFALKRIEEDNFKQTVSTKVSVSKTSIIVLILYFTLCLISIII